MIGISVDDLQRPIAGVDSLDIYLHTELSNLIPDPEVDKWVLMESPGNILMIVAMYLVFVLKIGPAFMKNREPMNLRKSMVIYNGIQVLFSVMLVWMVSSKSVNNYFLGSSFASNLFLSDL